jgi:hypothetical protein
LEAFDFDIRYKNTKQHGNADGISRLPVVDKNSYKVDEVDIMEIDQIDLLPVTFKDLQTATSNDKTVEILIQGLIKGNEVKLQDRFNINQSDFSLQQGCLLRGTRVYIPMIFRERILKELHCAHFGISRMKALARSYCWWPAIDSDIEKIVGNCMECQLVKSEPAKAPKHIWEPANEPFERVHVDYAGPFLDKYFLIIVDSFSKWLDVKICKDITTKTTISCLRNFFTNFGLCQILVSDHGPQFTSAEFQDFFENEWNYS